VTVPWDSLELWPVRAVLVGGAILLVGRLLVLVVGQPARRALIGTATVAVALLALPLTLLPGWLPVTVPGPEASAANIPQGGAFVRSSPSAPEPDRDPEYVVILIPDSADGAVGAAAPVVEATAPTAPEPVPAMSAAPNNSPTNESASAADGFGWGDFLLAAYGLIALALLARLGLGHAILARRWHEARPAPEWVERVFRELAVGVCPRARLRVCTQAPGPVCFGVFRPRVVVPAGLVAAGDVSALRCVFAHELGHLGRRDPTAGWLLGLARAAYFVWPWLAGLRREVRLSQEYLADADAARHAAGPADYAELLIRMTRLRSAPLGAAGADGTKSELYRRVTMLLKTSGRVERRCPRRWALAAGGGLTALAVLAAGLYVQPRPAVGAEPEKPASKPDPLKEAIDKLKKDVGGDPEAVRQLEELLKTLQKDKPASDTPKAPAVPAPPVAVPPGLAGPADIDKMMQMYQQMMRQYVEQLQAQMRGAGAGRGAIGARGVMIGPDGALRPFGALTTGGGRLGVKVERPSDVLQSQLDLPNGQGLVCLDVPADSPAGKAGIKPHDILLEVGGKPVPNDVTEFVKNLKDVKPDAAVDVVVLRKGKKETVKGVKLPEAKEPPAVDFPGLNFPVPPALDLPQLPLPPATPRPAGRVKPLPLPGPGADTIPPGLGNVRKVGVTAGPGESVRVEQVNEAFTVFYEKDGIKLTVTGTKEEGGAAKAESIEVEENGKTTKAESVEKLPKQYQEMAKKALGAIK
jgi:beta-lactamase regulating signal transducer with metallopeptidase domain